MFRRPLNFTADYDQAFGVVFGVTFVATLVIFPLVLLAIGAPQGATPGTAGAYVFALAVGVVVFAVPLLLKAGLLAPLVFLACVVLLHWFVPRVFSFVAAATVSAFVSCYVGFVTNIDLFPPAMYWDATRQQMGLSLALTASSLAALASAPIWWIYHANGRASGDTVSTQTEVFKT